MKKIRLNKNEMLVLRTSGEDGISSNGFKWPRSGHVEAIDWNNAPNCGGGLHGLPRGCGDGSLMDWSESATSQVVKVNTAQGYFEFEGKCKFASGDVVYFGELSDAIAFIALHYPDLPIVGKLATAGDNGTATAGYRGTATAGNRGTATAGYKGTATAGYYGTATAGYYGTATAGLEGTAIAGDNGTATAGFRGTATAGDKGIINIKYYDGSRYRLVIGYIGENGLLPNTPYLLDNDHNFVAC
jgi:hypothetical protein